MFNASHMAGFDVPMVAHDMILRFMGVDLGAAATGGQHAQLPSSVGDDVREGVVLPPSSTDSAAPTTSTGVSDEDAARWEGDGSICPAQIEADLYSDQPTITLAPQPSSSS